jgi:hypothetical protein
VDIKMRLKKLTMRAKRMPPLYVFYRPLRDAERDAIQADTRAAYGVPACIVECEVDLSKENAGEVFGSK